MQNKNKTGSFLHRCSTQLILAAMALLLVGFLVFAYHADQDAISAVADETLSFMRAVCQRYDNYAAGTRTSELKASFDKANGLADLAKAADLTDPAYLQRFAKTQHLTGVLVTDGALNPAAQADLNGNDAYALWQDFLKTDNKREIVKYKSKSYSGTVTLDGTPYIISIVSRRDSKGLVLCYRACTDVLTDVYQTSLEKTLDNNTFHKNPRIVVTDGAQLLASNIPELPSGTAVTDCPIRETNEAVWANERLVRIKWDGAAWYGKRLVYEQYYIYVFYPAEEVFSNMLSIISVGIAVCAFVCLILLLIRYLSERRFRERDRRQLNTIRAISSLFITTSVLHLDNNTIEGIVSTPRAQAILDETNDARQVAALLAERVIAPEYGDAYKAFLDFATMEDRLRGKTSINDVCRDVNGVWFGLYLVPVEYSKDGRLKSALFLSRDVNAYLQNEKKYQDELRSAARDAEVANAAKSSFLRRMSHDLRTPINGVRGMASMALQSLDQPDKARKYLEKIISSSDYLNSILEDILRMSKLESGKVEFEERSFNLENLVQETADFIAERADESGVHFTMEIQPLPHTQVTGSPLHIRQVLQNVLSNAVKFTPTGGSVRAVCREKDCADGVMQFEFVCTDTGIGMTEEFQKHIFEPFTQEDNSARSVLTGTGLGLPIAKEILDHCGGTITVQSRKNEGSVFTVTLPFKLDTAAQPAAPAGNAIDGVRILVVEDNELNMEIACCLLEEQGAVITRARNGREALDCFTQAEPGSFDVILMDIMMPEIDGLEATRRIRALPRSDAKTVPIFAMTANAFVDDLKLSRDAGMNAHLTKPLNMDELTAMICRYCSK